MKVVVTVLRVFVGILFIISGLIKVNDPSGLAYKMDEYFAVWHWDWASQFSLGLSIAMNCFEIVAGVALLLGWAKDLITRLLLLLIVFFTFLTGYAVLSGKIKTCGCFGDCVPLEAWQSFVKDLVLLVMIVILFIYRKYITPILNTRASLFAVLFSLGLSFWAQLNVLKHLPYVDCLPYASGKNLLQQMQAPLGSVPDSMAIYFKYTKDGKEVSFDANSFPEDFDENSYAFVGREEKLIRKGNATPAIQDFALFTPTGTDITKSFLANEKDYLLFFARNFDGSRPEWEELFTKIYSIAREQNIPVIMVTNQAANAQQYFNQQHQYALPVLTCDGTVMKTFLRTETGIVAMKGATVQKKLAEADMNDIVKYINQLKKP